MHTVCHPDIKCANQTFQHFANPTNKRRKLKHTHTAGFFSGSPPAVVGVAEGVAMGGVGAGFEMELDSAMELRENAILCIMPWLMRCSFAET